MIEKLAKDYARFFDIKATVVMPETAPRVKIDRTEELGAKVILAGTGPAGGAPSQDAGQQSTAKEIWIPASTAMRKFDRDPLDAPIDELLVTVKEGVSTRRTAQIIEPLLIHESISRRDALARALQMLARRTLQGQARLSQSRREIL